MAETIPTPPPRGYPGDIGRHPAARRQALALRAHYEGTGLELKVERFLAVADPLDCLTELAYCRAMFEEFRETFEQQNVWARQWAQAKVDGTDAPPPPTRWLYPDDGLKYMKLIAEIATKVQEVRQKVDTVTRAELRQTIFRMAEAVEQAVARVELTDGWRVALIQEIGRAWDQILV